MSEHSVPRQPMQVSRRHLVTHAPLQPPFPEHLETAIFGKGCFWSVEQSFWQLNGTYTTAAGYAGGTLEHPTYAEICATDTGHAEVVLVVYDPANVSYDRLLDHFWKGHKPIRSRALESLRKDQYRSVIFTSNSQQLQMARDSRDRYEARLPTNQRVTTEIATAPTFYYAETKHQQYLFRRARASRTGAT